MSVQPEGRDKLYEIVEETDEKETDVTEMDATDAMEMDATEVTETDVRTTLLVTSNDSRAPPPLARR